MRRLKLLALSYQLISFELQSGSVSEIKRMLATLIKKMKSDG
jgi:hypothetical protein